MVVGIFGAMGGRTGKHNCASIGGMESESVVMDGRGGVGNIGVSVGNGTHSKGGVRSAGVGGNGSNGGGFRDCSSGGGIANVGGTMVENAVNDSTVGDAADGSAPESNAAPVASIS